MTWIFIFILIVVSLRSLFNCVFYSGILRIFHKKNQKYSGILRGGGVGPELDQETWLCRAHLDDFLVKTIPDHMTP